MFCVKLKEILKSIDIFKSMDSAHRFKDFLIKAIIILLLRIAIDDDSTFLTVMIIIIYFKYD